MRYEYYRQGPPAWASDVTFHGCMCTPVPVQKLTQVPWLQHVESRTVVHAVLLNVAAFRQVSVRDFEHAQEQDNRGPLYDPCT